MDVRIEATVATIGLTIVEPVVAAVRRWVNTLATVFVEKTVASFPRTLSFGNTSLSAVSPDSYKNGGLYALV